MKKRILVALILSGLIVFPSCQSNSKVKKDQVKTEETKVKVEKNISKENKSKSQETKNITKDKAKEIAIKAFESYFDEKIDESKLEEKIELIPDQTTPNPYWFVEYTKPNGKSKGKTIQYMANIDSKNGKILNISEINIDKNKKAQKFDLKEAIDIALDFVKKKNLHNVDQLEFIKNNDGGEMYPQEDEYSYNLDFRYIKDKNKQISIIVDKRNKKVNGYGVSNELIKD